MRDFLTPFFCGGDGEECGCGGTFEIVKPEPVSEENADDPDCGDDCACHDTDGEDCDCDCDCESDNSTCCC